MPKHARRTVTKTRTTTKVALMVAAGIAAAAAVGYAAVKTPIGQRITNSVSQTFSSRSLPPGYIASGYTPPGYRPTAPGYRPTSGSSATDGLRAGMKTSCAKDGWVIESKVVALKSLPKSRVIKGSKSSLYWYAKNGSRYVFPNEITYRTWFPKSADCPSIIEVKDADLKKIPIGGNMTIKPFSKFIKITTDSKVYVVSKGGIAHWVETERALTQIGGPNWKKNTLDLPDAFFVNYSIGKPIKTRAEYDRLYRAYPLPAPDTNLGL